MAAAAGVDSALVHHYFGTKERLFAAAVRIPIDPMEIIGPLREVPVDDLGYQLPATLLPLWDSELGAGVIATIRSVLAGSEVNLIRSFIEDVIAVEIGSRVDDPPGSGIIRIQFVASQLVGVVMARYILELEPFKSLPPERIARTIAPNLQRYLTGSCRPGPRHEPQVLVVAHRLGFVDQQHRDPVLDAVGAAQARVVQPRAVGFVDQQQWPAVGGADQNAQ
ncbi:bacterial regulatory s, tetR family protein [Mycobacterium xenopi 3993]|nr:bacterial regulatory s, tetR family protein [Mycobacterium xenopi 3993]